MRRRDVLIALAAPAASSGLAAAAAPDREGGKVLRYAFSVAETGFDPAQLNDIYSRAIAAHIFDALLRFDHLARPYQLVPSVAAAMPDVAQDFRRFTFRIRPGIYFADDPAFKGRKRELVAEDFVYSMKRIYDPALKSPSQSILEDEGIIGLRELREDALKHNKPFNYDGNLEGLRALDRYTLQVRLRESRPRHLFTWAAPDVYGVVAREVVEAYGDKIMEHPVGTGPFMLTRWRRSSRMVLERNPNYRDEFYAAIPNADDAEGQALLARFKGRKLPMIDRVEIDVIEQSQPRWLAFLNGEHNFLERMPAEFADIAMPGGRLAPHLAKRGIHALVKPASDVTLIAFNMEDRVVGGYAPGKVALRRAMALGTNVAREIVLARHGQGIPAQSIVAPMTSGYRGDLHSEAGSFDRARAKALLDIYGYIDRDGDGWREAPDGQPLTIELASEADQITRALDELWKKDMDALGLRVELRIAQWPENLKAVRAGNFMVWRVGVTATSPDGQQLLEWGYGPSRGKNNLSRFQLPQFDRVYEQMKALPDGAERQALFDRAVKLLAAYAPYRCGVHRIITDMCTNVVGYRRPAFWFDWWSYVDVEASARKA